jgi:hypothetical protein
MPRISGGGVIGGAQLLKNSERGIANQYANNPNIQNAQNIAAQ